MVHMQIGLLISFHCIVIHDSFDKIIIVVKAQLCIHGCNMLTIELKDIFKQLGKSNHAFTHNIDYN
jgi:hypothetical protein